MKPSMQLHLKPDPRRTIRAASKSLAWAAGLAWAVAPMAFSAETDQTPARQQPPRNIIFILTDDHRYDAMGFMGHPFIETPNLDRLARDGAHFENAFVTTSLCSPSRASIVTGQYAHNHGVVDNYNPAPDDHVYVQEYLQKAGYGTAFVGKWHFGGERDDRRPGFDHWVGFKGQGVYWPHATGLKVKGRYVPQATNSGFNINGKRAPQKGYITDELTDYAIDWLDDQTAEKPFFLYLSHKAAHADFLPPNRYAYRYEKQTVIQPPSPTTHPELFTNPPMWVRNQRNSRHGVEFAYYTDLDMAQYYRRYCETILAVDESVGRIIQWLESRDMLKSTLLVYMGDNGFLFGEHGLIDKRCAYEESMRVPLLLHCPEMLTKGSKIKENVANIDIAPTLLEVAGLKTPDRMDGASFLKLAQGQKIPWRQHLLYEYYWERNYPQTPTMHALRGQRYKYIRYHGIWDVDELYDLQYDPRERKNLIDSPAHQDIVKSLNQKLFQTLRETSGMDLPLVSDRGTKFRHRRNTGSRIAPFPEHFYRAPDKN
jgi:N-acetylglucosamine-6-sulfatase